MSSGEDHEQISELDDKLQQGVNNGEFLVVGTASKKHRAQPVHRESYDAKINSSADVVDLRIRNIYESQVLATMGTIEGGRRIMKYYCPRGVESSLGRTINAAIVENMEKAAITSKYFDKIHSRAPTFELNQEIECDLYVQLPFDTGASTVSELLKLSTVDIFSLNGHDAREVSLSGKWVLLEISDSPHHLAHKLFQLERALHLLPTAVNDFLAADVGALVVLLNGDREEAVRAVNFVKKDFANMEMAKYPVFVGWVPYRNMFTRIGQLDDDIQGLNETVHALKNSVDKFFIVVTVAVFVAVFVSLAVVVMRK
jgi:hypothetical protein